MESPAALLVLLLGACVGGCGDDNESGGPPVEPIPSLDPKSIAKFSEPLLIPPEMPSTGKREGVTEYRIAIRQFEQQVLPPPLPKTTVWGYGRDGDPLPGDGEASTFSYPGFTVETRSNSPVRVTWINGLVDEAGGFLPHLLPVDATLHWADPGAPVSGHAHSGDARYTGPVPLTTHVHGAHSFAHSDGHPESWFLPDASNLPEGFAKRGPFYHSQSDAGEGAAVFEYPQDEGSATLWYHDHTLGLTRLNIHAGLAGFWLIRDEAEDALELPGPAPRVGDAPETRYYEIPLVIQDRIFKSDGSLSYPTSRAMYDGYRGPFVPDSEISPVWGPEFIGNVIVVNGRTWPYLEVEPRLYRFRVLNGSDARTLMLSLEHPELGFIQIATEDGFVSERPLEIRELTLAPAERVDMLIDFSRLEPGNTLRLLNVGPDEPWGGPDADPPQKLADRETTGQILEFRVVARSDGGSAGRVPSELPSLTIPATERPPRDLMLFEASVEGDFPIHDQLGTVKLGPLQWADDVSEVIRLDDTEVWRIANTTDDVHPIHVHLVDFVVLDRTPFDSDKFLDAEQRWLKAQGDEPALDDFVTGAAVEAAPTERGEKDTVQAPPGMITRIVAKFDRAGTFVWHCHIIEHEDNDMMRPFEIVPD